MSVINLNITTAEGEIFSGDVDSVTLPGEIGEMTILPSHAQLISTLSSGEMKLKINKEEQFLSIIGGFIQVNKDSIVILADAAERVEEIDEAKVQEAIKQAEEEISNSQSDIDLANAVASIRRDQVRLKIVQKRRSSNRPPSVS